ncbi:MAG: 50S ribosomal protein L18 [Candidatus Aenigmarchaeota archaeon]|nr:50S ribosomal protein L18 [Candidatus Aenigmarchaeota archaeon]
MRKRTDYRLRLRLLKSGKPRIVARKSLNRIVAQIIRYEPKGDIVVAEKTSVDLAQFGWNGHKGNIPAAYLTGLLIGLEGAKNSIEEAVLDFGMQRVTKGCALLAFSKGVKDSGMKIKIDEDAMPSDERTRGKDIEKYTKKSIAENFEAAKKKIIESYR